jgi:hypothetical protein
MSGLGDKAAALANARKAAQPETPAKALAAKAETAPKRVQQNFWCDALLALRIKIAAARVGVPARDLIEQLVNDGLAELETELRKADQARGSE